MLTIDLNHITGSTWESMEAQNEDLRVITTMMGLGVITQIMGMDAGL